MAPRRITVDPRTLQEPRFGRRRILEPEAADGPGEIAARLGGPAAARLDRLDEAFVRAALRIAGPGARILDIGTGTAAIPVRMAERRPDLHIVGIDLSDSMLAAARDRIREARLGRRVRVRKGSPRRLPFARRTFDLVVSSSFLHHLPDPVPAFDEMARVLKPSGRIFVQDLRRPGPGRIAAHIRRHARPYSGVARRLFAASVRAAFKVSEVRAMVEASRLKGCRVRPRLEAYVVVEGAPRRRRRR